MEELSIGGGSEIFVINISNIYFTFIFIEEYPNFTIHSLYINWVIQDSELIKEFFFLKPIFGWWENDDREEILTSQIQDYIKELILINFEYLDFQEHITQKEDLVDDEVEEDHKWHKFMENIDDYLENLELQKYILSKIDLDKTLRNLVYNDFIYLNYIEAIIKELILDFYYLK